MSEQEPYVYHLTDVDGRRECDRGPWRPRADLSLSEGDPKEWGTLVVCAECVAARWRRQNGDVR